MKNFFQNIWTKRAVSIFSLVYGGLLALLAYMSVFYNLQIENSTSFIVFSSVLSVIFLAIMIYTRKQFFTRFVSVIALPLFLPILLFYFGEWLLIIPLAVVIVIMFFVSGAGEATKTILGTLFLLLYVIGAVAYFLFSTFMGNNTQDTICQVVESDSKLYRSYVVDTIDSSTGGTKIYVEPNNLDKNFKYVRFIAKGYKKLVYSDRNHYTIKMEWDTEKHDDLPSLDNDAKMNMSYDLIETLAGQGILSWDSKQLEAVKKILSNSDNSISYNEDYGLIFNMELNPATAEMLNLKDETIKHTEQVEQVTVKNTAYYTLGLSKMQRQIFAMTDEGDCALDTEQIDHLVSVAVMPIKRSQCDAIIEKMNNGATAMYYDECDKYPEGAIEFDFGDISAEDAQAMGLEVKSEETTEMIDKVTEEDVVYFPATLPDNIMELIGLTDEGDVLYITAYDENENIVENSNGEKLDRMLYFRYDEAVMNRWFSIENREFEIK